MTPTRIGITFLAIVSLAQGQMTPRFEVASVKLNTVNGPPGVQPQRSGDLVTMHNTQPYSVICDAYHLQCAYQMVGYILLSPTAGTGMTSMREREAAT